MTYLFIGPDLPQKDAKIAEIKAKTFSDPAALAFDYEVLYAHKLDPDTLMKSLLSLPHLAPKRMVVLRQCERAVERIRDILLEFLNTKSETTVLVLDFHELDPKSALLAKLRPLTKAQFFGQEGRDIWDMTDAIRARNPAEALKIFYELLDKNNPPLKILGGVVWFWGKEGDRMNRERFQKGLMVLEEADLNIKRSRLKPEYAIEKVVVELASL